MAKINDGDYTIGGRNFKIESHLEANRVSFSAFEQIDSEYKLLPIDNYFLTDETNDKVILASDQYKQHLGNVGYRVLIYTQQSLPPDIDE